MWSRGGTGPREINMPWGCSDSIPTTPVTSARLGLEGAVMIERWDEITRDALVKRDEDVKIKIGRSRILLVLSIRTRHRNVLPIDGKSHSQDSPRSMDGRGCRRAVFEFSRRGQVTRSVRWEHRDGWAWAPNTGRVECAA